MKYRIRLVNFAGGELDACIIEQPEGPDGDFYLSVRVADVIKHWDLSIGDRIAIEEA